MIPILLLYAFFLPYLLWPIELVLPFPFIVEEIAKAFLVVYLLDIEKDTRKRIYIAAAIGACFAFTESVFYLFNIALVGNIFTYLIRLLLTIPLHSSTTLIILFSVLMKNRRKDIIYGVILAAIIHFLYNFLISKVTHIPL